MEINVITETLDCGTRVYVCDEDEDGKLNVYEASILEVAVTVSRRFKNTQTKIEYLIQYPSYSPNLKAKWHKRDEFVLSRDEVSKLVLGKIPIYISGMERQFLG